MNVCVRFPFSLVVHIGRQRYQVLGRKTAMANPQVLLTDSQETTVHVSGLDDAQKAGAFLKPPQWAIGDPLIAAITPSLDGSSCLVIAANPGKTTLLVTDEDDPAVPALTLDVVVVAGKVSHLSVTVDPPVPQASVPKA